MRSIRSSFQQKKTGIGLGTGTAIIAGFFGKKSAGKLNALNRDRLRIQQENALKPYRDLSLGIDNAVMQIDQLKTHLEVWILERKQA